jgi:DNA-binding CsgD family transcriptional regulator
MPGPGRKTRAAARIRNLACLDVGGPQLAPLVLQELRALIAFDTGGYFSLDAEGRLDASMEAPEIQAVLPLYFSEHMQRCERQVARTFADAVHTDFGPRTAAQLMTVPLREFQRNDYYGLMLRPLQIDDCVSLIPRLSRFHVTGALKLYRRSPRQPFQREELREFARLERFLALALEQRPPPPEIESDTRDNAMMVASASGQVQWLSPQAPKLLMLAFGASGYQHPTLPEPLRLMLHNLQAVLRADERAEAPQYECRNVHGRFSFRAYQLQAGDGPGAAVGIQICHHVPRALRVLQALRRLDLPPRQSETCYWLVRGLPETQIAARLRVSHHTVVSHRRQLYARLGVQGRQGLIDHLLKPEALQA